MPNPLTMKLEQYTRFTPAERGRLDDLLNYPRKVFAPREIIIREGDRVDHIHLVLTGLAARSKSLPDGDRQVMAFLVPGDLCDLEVFVLRAMDHDIVAVSETTCLLVPTKAIEDLLTEFSTLTRALWWSTMTDSAVLRARIIDHGSRDAHERLAHLFYELLIRYRVIGGATDNSFAFPASQEELADATGITPVHANRILQQLRSEGLIELKNKVMTVADPERLKQAARFESNYLHLDRSERPTDVSARAGDLI